LSKNPISVIPFIELAKSQIQCGYEKQAIEMLEAVVKDLKEFISTTTQKNREI